MNKFSINKLDILSLAFLFTVFAYFSQGVLYPRGSIYSQFFLLLNLSISSYFLLKVLNEIKRLNSALVIFWSLFLLINIVAFLLVLDPLNLMYQSQFKAILLFCLSFYSVYYLTKRGSLNDKRLILFFAITLPVLYLNFDLNRESVLSGRVSDNEDVVNNVAYNFIALLPFLFLIKNRLMSIALSIFILIAVIDGAKRGALVVGIVGIIMFAVHLIMSGEQRHRVKDAVFAFIGITVVGLYAARRYASNEFLIRRMESITEGSGRNVIFSNLLSDWSNQDNLFNLFFGSGFASTLSVAGNYAHNDWLEILTNYGIFGVVVYLIIYISSFRLCFLRQGYTQEYNRYKLLMFTVLLMMVTKSMFSMVFTSFGSIYYVIMLAFLAAKLESSKGVSGP